MIMTTNEFNRIKQEVLDRAICYREVEAKEIVALGENHYTVGNATLEVEPQIAAVIDRFAGIKQGQSRIAQDSYGEQGLTNLRNFFGQAEVKGSKRLVLAADILDRQIVNAIPIKDRMITPDVFFDFAEMFMDKNNYLPERVEHTHSIKTGVSILMRPVHEEIMEYAPGDEFISNGLYLTWNPGEINLGNYYERLVCSNGSTKRSHHSITKVYSPEVKELGRLLELNEVFAPLKRETEKMVIMRAIRPIEPRFEMTCSLAPILRPMIKQRPYTVPSIAGATHGNCFPFFEARQARIYPITMKLQYRARSFITQISSS